MGIAIFSNSLALNIKPTGPARSDEDLNSAYLAGKTDGIAIIPSANSQFELEKLLLLRPDLIVGSSGQLNQGLYERLSQIAPTVLLPWKGISYDWKQSFEEMAAVLNRTETATQLMNNYNSRVEDIKQAISPIDSQDSHQNLHAAFAFVASALKDLFKSQSLVSITTSVNSRSFADQLPHNPT